MNKRAIEALIKCGALDGLGHSRLGMLEERMLEQIVQYGQRAQADRLAGQASIFDLGGEEEQGPRHHPVIPTVEFEKSELLKLEKESLGLYVSEHPLHAVREQLRRKTDCSLSELERRRDGEVVTVGGIVSAVKQLTTKKGEPMVFLTLDDPTGGGEVVVFNSTYATARELCTADRVLVVKGRVDHKQQGETKLIALEVSAFEAVQERTEIRFKLDARETRAGVLKELALLVRGYPGESPVFVAMETSTGPKTFALGPRYRVAIDTDFLTEAKHLLGADCVL
jgi:DNA polymerase III subunit alpha